ncbi:hypothetical protein GCM10011611_18270 [Aliidongia dinghuensis]|uniref:Uncharacterized protein n=1 Tax=Aliidongia dinghuensis TaxID=1867774 RepID=A0A8J2YSK1_9PROT|nr:hypothetical protein [Aliidongia dinghuensis]GGF12934.1 hypothetical protein GCM10011611_18270 [Aliidongia dinghuensis]
MFESIFAVEKRPLQVGAKAPRAKAVAWSVSEDFDSDQAFIDRRAVVAIFGASFMCWGVIVAGLTALYHTL